MSKYQRKRAVKAMMDLPDPAFAEAVDEVTDKLAEERPKDEIVHVVELEPTLKKVRADRGKFKGFSTGYTQLDKKMGGLEPGSVVLIAGETSHGKSALATNIAAHVASKTPLLYVSLEMTLEQMIDRLDWIAGERLPTLEMVFQKSFAITYRDLEPLIRKSVEKHQVKVVVLDYLQYLGRGMTLDEVAKMSREIKMLATTYGVCMVVITSVRKGSAEAKFRRKWTDIEVEEIMGSAAIGYDADTIVLVSRKDEEGEFDDAHIRIKVLKTRNSKLDYKDRIVCLDWDQTRISEDMKIA